MIAQETIDQIFSAVRIEEVVGDFVTLKRRGVNMIGLCPFHNEKTPSFTVSPVKGIFKCFGCGKAGNAVNFLMEHEHFTYPEALRFLARKYQIEVEEEEVSPGQQEEINERERLFNLNQFAADYFIHTLHTMEEGKAVGLSYLKEREIRDDIIRKFQIGYCPSVWDAFTSHAQKNGYTTDILVESGLTLQKEERYYDRFHSRIIFPIHSASGRIIGFGGRILSADKNRPKYINSPESSIYNKSKSLYGLYFARNAIASHDDCYLVEGYTDVIALHQAGIEQTVASSGTSLTQEQIRLIRRYTTNITILYDGDPAGIKASFRGIDMILEEGMNVRIVLFPDGEDPDSFTRKHHPDEVKAFIANHAENFILFKTHLLLKETAGDPIRKASLIKEIVATIGLIPDGITQSVYVKECAEVMEVPEQILMNEVRKIVRSKLKKGLPATEPTDIIAVAEKTPPQEEFALDPDEYQEKELIRLLLLYGEAEIPITRLHENNQEEVSMIQVADFMVMDLSGDDLHFRNPTLEAVFSVYREGFEQGRIPSRDQFISHADPEISRTAIDLMVTPYELSDNWEKNNIFIETEEKRIKQLVFTAILSFKGKKLDTMIAEKLLEIQTITDPADQAILLQELKNLKQSSMLINKELGRVITR
ncbi:MAG: DNA primase [Bacteroidales bacterium]|nr:DNA primase [Bacteroidales bacterium]